MRVNLRNSVACIALCVLALACKKSSPSAEPEEPPPPASSPTAVKAEPKEDFFVPPPAVPDASTLPIGQQKIQENLPAVGQAIDHCMDEGKIDRATVKPFDVRLRIFPDGVVRNIKVSSEAPVQECIAEAVMKVRFPEWKGAPVEIAVPYEFKRTGPAPRDGSVPVPIDASGVPIYRR